MQMTPLGSRRIPGYSRSEGEHSELLCIVTRNHSWFPGTKTIVYEDKTNQRYEYVRVCTVNFFISREYFEIILILNCLYVTLTFRFVNDSIYSTLFFVFCIVCCTVYKPYIEGFLVIVAPYPRLWGGGDKRGA